jgi:pimeloyl-ACP methyl ester carboxylesterase
MNLAIVRFERTKKGDEFMHIQLIKQIRSMAIFIVAIFSILTVGANAQASGTVAYKTVKVDGLDIFYREGGDPQKPTLLLLHGFPASSHMFRELIPKLATKFHVVAPDYPGFGYSSAPSRNDFKYTFDNVSSVVDKFTQTIGLKKYAIYVQDYGSPVGFRLAVKNPEKITGLIVQNGNAYEEGLTDLAEPLKVFGKTRDAKVEQTLRGFMTLDGTKFQYVQGAKDASKISPDAWTFDQSLLDRPGIKEIQLDLFADYHSNLKAYPTWHEYLKKNQPPTLIVWGKHDPFFGLQNIDGFRRDLKNPEVHILDGGHFVLEEQPEAIAGYILEFFTKQLAKR